MELHLPIKLLIYIANQERALAITTERKINRIVWRGKWTVPFTQVDHEAS
jgi:hypothetical protein